MKFVKHAALLILLDTGYDAECAIHVPCRTANGLENSWAIPVQVAP